MLEQRAKEYAEYLRVLKEHPGAVVCAELDLIPDWNKGRSNKVAPSPLASQLQSRLSRIAPINTIANGNVVGGCAEVHASSYLLIQDEINYTVYDLKFSKALRPRTMETIEMCENCKTVFT